MTRKSLTTPDDVFAAFGAILKGTATDEDFAVPGDDDYDDFDVHNQTDTCPECGIQDVVGYGTTRGPDPYGINELACGHGVICLGPGDPNVIVSTKRNSGA